MTGRFGASAALAPEILVPALEQLEAPSSTRRRIVGFQGRLSDLLADLCRASRHR